MYTSAVQDDETVESLRFRLAATRNGYDAQRAEIERLHGLINVLRGHLDRVVFDPIHPDPEGVRRCVLCGAPEKRRRVDHDPWCATQRRDELFGPANQNYRGF